MKTSNKKSPKPNVAWVVSVSRRDLADGSWDILAVRHSSAEATNFIKGLIVEWVEDNDLRDYISDEEADRLRAAWAGGTDTVFELVNAWNDIECFADKIDLQDFGMRSSDDSDKIDCPV